MRSPAFVSQPHTVETHGLAAQIINAVQCAAAGGDSVGELVNGKETQTKIWGEKKKIHLQQQNSRRGRVLRWGDEQLLQLET